MSDGPRAPSLGYKRAMTNARRFQLDELTLRPGTYFNPQTEIMIVVDDSPEVDHEIFEADEFDSHEWVLIAEDTPLDEHQRDDLVERFQLAQHRGRRSSTTTTARRRRGRPRRRRAGRGRGGRRRTSSTASTTSSSNANDAPPRRNRLRPGARVAGRREPRGPRARRRCSARRARAYDPRACARSLLAAMLALLALRRPLPRRR